MTTRLRPSLLALVAAVLLAACAAPPPDARPVAPPGAGPGPVADEPAVVATETGAVRGAVEGQHRRFSGVPYAAPPVGERRFRSPAPASPWSGVRDTTGPSPLCAQDGLELGRPSSAEDCLTLDVTAPRASAPAPRPVVIWVHGGSFVDGGAAMYGAARLADRGDVVVVAVNYRLGALGFLAHPALPDSGSLGLEDQQAALRWVQRHARAFGGDPGNVTLAGESAGATSVCAHLTSPAAAGLFHRAILQSADCTARWSGPGSSAPRDRAVAERRGIEIAEALGCRDPRTAAACLRAAPVDAIRAASGDGEGLGPTFGVPALPAEPALALTAGRAHRVPVLLGMNADEERFRLYGEELAGGPTTRADLVAELGARGGRRAPELLAAYPCDADACAATTLAAARTDAEYARGTVELAGRLAASVPTWTYEFADPRAPWFLGLPPSRFPSGAYHTAELPFLFDVSWSEPLAPAQDRLAEQMIGYWTRFARSGDPGGPDAPGWAPHRGPADVQTLAPDRVGPTPEFAARHRLALWSSLVRGD